MLPVHSLINPDLLAWPVYQTCLVSVESCSLHNTITTQSHCVTCTTTYIHMYIIIHVYNIRIYVCTYVHIYIHIYMHTHTHLHTYIHTYVYTYIQPYIHTFTHTYIIYTNIHTYRYTFNCCKLQISSGRVRKRLELHNYTNNYNYWWCIIDEWITKDYHHWKGFHEMNG